MKELDNIFLMKFKLLISLIIFQLLFVNCGSEDKNPSQTEKVEAFKKINQKSSSLFNKESRINSYKNSVANTKNLKSSLNKNDKYSGYGSSKEKKNTKSGKKQEKSIQDIKTKKVNFKSNSNNVYSAYSTN
tara:strand:+ start:650 stop:1042 length:393 start_codon:yes stop_codon:yes gene_type:complete